MFSGALISLGVAVKRDTSVLKVALRIWLSIPRPALILLSPVPKLIEYPFWIELSGDFTFRFWSIKKY